MDCDQVFMILTRGPFPTGEAWDEQVEAHLETCAECWRLAEALRPALEVFQEAVPPAESPQEVAPAPETKVAPSANARKERARKPKPAPDESIPRAEPADGDEEVTPSEAPRVQQLPRGRTRAKFIGVTADGNWMFSLPNKKIVIVPPPPGG